MQFPFLLAVLAALVIAENCPPGPVDGVVWRSELTAVAIILVVIAAQAITTVTALQMRRHPEDFSRILSASGRWRRMHTVLWIGSVALVSLGTGWPQIVRFNWGLDGTFLLDELLILVPALLPLMLSWVAFYGIERAAYSARLAAGKTVAGPAPSLKHFFALHARHYLGVMLVPILLLLAAQARPDFFRSLVLLCPADGASLLAGLDELESGGEEPVDAQEREYAGRFDTQALRPFLQRLDLVAAARGVPRVLLAHARDDESVPFAHSERLAAVLAPPSRFIRMDKGGHHGPGRSPHVARATLDWVRAQGA